jgi:hypothetical protein
MAPIAVGVTSTVPVACCVPFHPPLAVQLVPWFEDQVSVALCPSAMVVGAAVSDAVGAGIAGLSEPPPPPQPASTLPSAIAISPDHLAAVAASLFMKYSLIDLS